MLPILLDDWGIWVASFTHMEVTASLPRDPYSFSFQLELVASLSSSFSITMYID